MIKLIASDLDGTLLQNGAQALSPRSVELIRKITEKGIVFVAASGRQYQCMRTLFGGIRDKISYVAENGSLAFHENQLIFEKTIDDRLAHRILEELKIQNKFDTVVSCRDTCYIEGNDPDFVYRITDVMKNKTEIIDDLRTIQSPILKIAICNLIDGPHVIDKYLKHLQNQFGSEIKIVTSGNFWIDFIAPDTNKAVGLQHLLDKLQIRPEECIAFGDQYNDVEMLQYVGTGYAMSNAAPGISYYSDDVTDSVDDVLADILAEI
ncbi:Cof-type HAD-IIB family hydrolase [Hespellia stercorisuis]|uniref:Uncharacterized protein n=1 Tax=Hespellia stercorisuis DSM 15480 TaxID=1121950 RepID=A0A1M6NYM8_9FIRM|nr:Cof-type HAD-IIB family hydrolase [Hespellia stercorisuis]SHK00839.1 hypothetical protein SAMN02745243_01973 [Hespellia stercorisuis DSM 15480]